VSSSTDDAPIPGPAFLRNVPVLAGLADESLERLARDVREVRVRSGEWVIRQGDAADSLFIVGSGRLDVIDEGPPQVLIRVLRRGDVLGELALLHSGRRSVSVRARRDSELLELGRDQFEALVRGAPSVAVGLARTMGAQLAASRTPLTAATPPGTIAVVGLDAGAPGAEVADGLAGALALHGSVAQLDAGGLGTVDQAERDADRVLLRGASSPGDEWTDLCVREADLVVAVTSGRPDPAWLAHATSLRGCELLVLGPGISGDALAALAPREVQVVAEAARRDAMLAATARRLAGRSLGVVLSGGGARAFAHLGVLEGLSAAGLRFDRVAGVSLGALVAAATAMSLEPDAIYEIFERNFVATNPTSDFAIPAYSLIRGGKTRRLMAEAFGDRRIEELPLRMFCLSCDLHAREPVVHRTGPVIAAVYASLAIPGVFPPVATDDGRLLVDGGVLDNLPVATMARAGEGPILAVDVTGRIGERKHPQRPRLVRLARPLRRALTGAEAEIPRLGETMLRTLTVGSSDTVAAARRHADAVITPQVDAIGMLEWGALARVREIGRRAAGEALADPVLRERLGV
jgi:predicted acylesterase/phospholipase RssA/CRP-like cAMP-binding protein